MVKSESIDWDVFTASELIAALESAVAENVDSELVDELRERVIAADAERRWEITIDGGQGGDKTYRACSLADALDEAIDWARDGDWDTSRGTVHCTVEVSCELTGEEDSAHVSIDQDEPDCLSGEDHDWQSPYEIVGGCKTNPGVWGNGGGVLITEVCMTCGCAKLTDTWAQDPHTGTQGLTEVTYEPGKYADAIRAANELAEIGCAQMRRAAAYVLHEIRDDSDPVGSRLDGLRATDRDRAIEVAQYAVDILARVPSRLERRALRLALYLAAADGSQVEAARQVALAYGKG